MRPNTAPKFQDKPLTAEAHRKMILSFEECTSLPERELKCPYCSHYIEGVFADTTGHVRVKCNKCKAEMVLNVAYFRRLRKKLQRSRYQYEKIKETGVEVISANEGEVKNEVMEMLKEAAHYGRMFSENDN